MATRTKAAPVRELNEAEVAALGQIGASAMPVLPGDGGDLALTEAEVLILEAKGASVVREDEPTFAKEDPFGTDDGTQLFKIGSGKSQFTGTLTFNSEDREKVFLWHPETGVKRALVRAHLLFYVAKGWLPRPPVGVTPPPLNIKCLSMLPCKTRNGSLRMFATPHDATEHFEKAHHSEFKHATRQRERARADRLDALLENLIANGGQTGGNEALLTVLTALAGEVSALREQGGMATPRPAEAEDGATVAANQMAAVS